MEWYYAKIKWGDLQQNSGICCCFCDSGSWEDYCKARIWNTMGWTKTVQIWKQSRLDSLATVVIQSHNSWWTMEYTCFYSNPICPNRHVVDSNLEEPMVTSKNCKSYKYDWLASIIVHIALLNLSTTYISATAICCLLCSEAQILYPWISNRAWL